MTRLVTVVYMNLCLCIHENVWIYESCFLKELPETPIQPDRKNVLAPITQHSPDVDMSMCFFMRSTTDFFAGKHTAVTC